MEFAGVLAQEYDAHLTGVFMRPAPAVTPPEMFARGTGIPAVIEARQAEVEGIEADHRALFDDIVRRNAVGSEWRSVPYFNSDAGVHARYADLAVVARPDPAGQTAGPPGLVESLVLASGRPVIVLPPRSTASRLSRILIGWNAGREAARAVADALPLLIRAAAVEVLVIDPERRRPRPPERADLRRRDTHRPARRGSPGPDVPIKLRIQQYTGRGNTRTPVPG